MRLCKHFSLPNISIGVSSPKGVEWYLCLPHCGAVLGPQTCWSTRKWTLWQAQGAVLFRSL
jgi:hypothetical protein